MLGEKVMDIYEWKRWVERRSPRPKSRNEHSEKEMDEERERYRRL